MRGDPKVSDKTNITLSVDNKTMSTIKEEADASGMSTNAKVNQILGEYAIFGKYIRDRNPVIIAPPLFQFLLETVDEDGFIKGWNSAMSEITPSIFALYDIEFNLDNLIKHAFRDFGLRVGAFKNFTYSYEKDNIKLVFEHIYGIKWSRILARSLSEFFEKTFGLEVQSDVLDKIVTMRLYKR